MNFKIELSDVDHDKQFLKLNGMKLTMSYFVGIVLPSLLNGVHSADAVMVELAGTLQSQGFNLPQTIGHEAAQHYQRLKDAETQRKAEQQKLIDEAAARCHVDTPEEIAAYHAEKQKRIAETVARIRGGRVGGGHF